MKTKTTIILLLVSLTVQAAQNCTVYNVGSTNITGGTFYYHYKVGGGSVVSTAIGSSTIPPGGSAYFASRGYTNAQNMITWVKTGITYYPVELNGLPFTGGSDTTTWFNNTADGIGWNVGFAPFTPATSTYKACQKNNDESDNDPGHDEGAS